MPRSLHGWGGARRRAGGGWAPARRWVWAAAALGLGCSAEPGAGSRLGDDLGTFSVAAAVDTNDCGPGALGSLPHFDFDVELARDASELFWDGNVGGRLGPELDFVLAASVDVELRLARGEDPGCTIHRDDLISGFLEPDASGSVTAFSGAMRFDFAERTGSTCTAAEQDEADLPRLPCRMSYELSGLRTRAPRP